MPVIGTILTFFQKTWMTRSWNVARGEMLDVVRYNKYRSRSPIRFSSARHSKKNRCVVALDVLLTPGNGSSSADAFIHPVETSRWVVIVHGHG